MHGNIEARSLYKLYHNNALVLFHAVMVWKVGEKIVQYAATKKIIHYKVGIINNYFVTSESIAVALHKRL